MPAPSGGFLSGFFGGFGSNLNRIREENVSREQRQLELELNVMKELSNSPDPEIQARALTLQAKLASGKIPHKSGFIGKVFGKGGVDLESDEDYQVLRKLIGSFKGEAPAASGAGDVSSPAGASPTKVPVDAAQAKPAGPEPAGPMGGPPMPPPGLAAGMMSKGMGGFTPPPMGGAPGGPPPPSGLPPGAAAMSGTTLGAASPSAPPTVEPGKPAGPVAGAPPPGPPPTPPTPGPVPPMAAGAPPAPPPSPASPPKPGPFSVGADDAKKIWEDARGAAKDHASQFTPPPNVLAGQGTLEDFIKSSGVKRTPTGKSQGEVSATQAYFRGKETEAQAAATERMLQVAQIRAGAGKGYVGQSLNRMAELDRKRQEEGGLSKADQAEFDRLEKNLPGNRKQAELLAQHENRMSEIDERYAKLLTAQKLKQLTAGGKPIKLKVTSPTGEQKWVFVSPQDAQRMSETGEGIDAGPVAAVATRMKSAFAAKARVQHILDYFDELKQHIGPGQGRVSDFEELLGSEDPVVAKFGQDMSMIGGFLTSVHGARGIQFLNEMKNMTRLRDNPAAARATLKNLVGAMDDFTNPETEEAGAGAGKAAGAKAPKAPAGGPPALGAHQVGERKTFPNGRTGVWNGQNWIEQPRAGAPP